MALFRKKQTHQTRQSQISSVRSFQRGSTVLSGEQKRTREARQKELLRAQTMSQKLRRHRQRIMFGSICGVIIFAVLSLRFIITGAQLESRQELSGADRGAYESSLRQIQLEQGPLSHAWLTDADRVEREVLKKYPEFETVQIKSSMPLSTSWRYIVSARTPLFAWKDAAGEQKFLDRNGVLFSKNLTDTDVKQLLVIEDDSGLVVQSGNTALTSSATKLIAGLPEALKAVYPKGRLEKVIIPTSTREIRAYVKGERYFIKFSTERDLAEQVSELKTLKTFLASKKQTPREYVDIRLAKKAFYK